MASDPIQTAVPKGCGPLCCYETKPGSWTASIQTANEACAAGYADTKAEAIRLAVAQAREQMAYPGGPYAWAAASQQERAENAG